MSRYLLTAFILLIPRLCLAGSWYAADWQYWQCNADPVTFAAEYVDHPVVKPYGTPEARPARPAAEVETYYYRFNGWSDLYSQKHMKQWNVIAPGTKQDYKVDRQAQVVVYLPQRDDKHGVAMLREEVAKLGADAMVDVVRLVCLDPTPVGSQYSLWKGTEFKFPVVGWGYYGVAVTRRADASAKH